MYKSSQVNHYRNKKMPGETNETVSQTLIWKFKNELIDAVNKTFNVTGFKP